MADIPTFHPKRVDRAVQNVLDLQGRIGVVGLAFKENTDDLRESPVVTMIERMIGKGRDVRIYDPHISMESIYGSNRNFILNAIPHIGRLLSADLETILAWADHLVVAQKPDQAMAKRIAESGLPVLDLVGSKLAKAAVTLPAAHS